MSLVSKFKKDISTLLSAANGDIYLFDNGMQCCTAMEDIEYAKRLDPDKVPCYVRKDDYVE